ncbi:MAG: fused response regulator/phosphatase [Jatrophihabitans sp.]|nr:MAG: fused response regulator/phosphatase [Jatrophihabitans sp.]
MSIDRAGSPDTPVVLIEDDDGDALLVRACLAEAGFGSLEVQWCRTLAEGLAAVSRRTRCVLLDLGLPDAEGMSALTDAVTAAPDTPIIILTGRHDQAGTEALALGAQDYLVKDDITSDLLERSIRYAVERKRAQRTSLQLREARLSSAEKARLERGLLPTPLMRSGAVDCCTYYQPGRDHAVLGGDFFDVVETSDGRVRAVIGDVMGHGPDAAAIGVHLRVAWRTLVLAGLPDVQILSTLDSLFAAETGGDAGFVTACDVTIEPDGLTALRVAGHPAPLVSGEGKTHYLDLTVGPPLGVDIGAARQRWVDTGGWPQSRVQLDPGASLILYTDGLLDAFGGPTGASLGIEELVAAVDACVAGGGDVSSWIPSIVATAPGESVDDTAVVVLSLRPPTAGP